MPKVSVCVEIVYDDDPFHERVGRAARVGADGVEFWGWRGKDLYAIESVANEHGIPLVACGAGGTLTDPDGIAEAVETIRESIEMATSRGISCLICTTGPVQADVDRTTQRATIVDILTRVAPDAEAADVTLVLEPLNTAVDHPGCYLTDSKEGYEIVEGVESTNVQLLFDVYHQQITEGNIITNLRANIEKIGHIHIADVPGRHEPGTGELHFENIIDAIDDAGYVGYVGCEFSPLEDADDAMGMVVGWR